jgi:hypothetical protein
MKKLVVDINDMLNEYETQNTLNPKLWDGDRLHPKLRVGLLKIAKAFYRYLGIDTPIKDILLIGSSANYNWTKHSDIDLHVLINYLDINDNYHVVNELMHAKKTLWNQNYPLTFKGMNIELYAQDSKQEMHSSVGVYSMMRGKWLKKPNAETISIDDELIEKKAEPYAYEIDKLSPRDPKIEQRIHSLQTRLKHLRQSGLDSNGEYSIENMAFKHLRNKGYLERLNQFEKKITLSNLKIEHVDTEVTIDNIPDEVTESLIMHVTGQKRLQATDWTNVVMKTGAVVDRLGQWKHPGRCTMIPTQDGAITMQSVAHPVLGIDNTGHMQMMQPEQQYQFPGRLVFEIPHTAQWQTMIMQLQNAAKNGSKYK